MSGQDKCTVCGFPITGGGYCSNLRCQKARPRAEGLVVATKISPSILDLEYPEAKAGELVCDACWRVSADKRAWIYFNFKYLKPQNLCPQCVLDHAPRLEKLQTQGL